MPDLDAKLGWFVGYDSESKGFHIYWPNKQSATIEWDVIFNQEDVLTKSGYVIIPGDVLFKGGRDKVTYVPGTSVDSWRKKLYIWVL